MSATSNHPTAPHSTYSDAEIIEQLKQKLQYAELKIRVLEERLRLQRIAKYGPGSEKLSDAQLQLLELEPGVSSAEVEAESQREALPSTPTTKRKHPGRQTLPANLPRIERVIACAPEQCVCGGCGADTAVIGYEESEQLDVEPAKYFVLVTKREKRACKRCEERGVMAAPLPPRIIEKSLVSDRIVIGTVIDKYVSHLPLYRQSAILQRDAGLQVSRATLDGWVMRVGELLTPIVGVMRRELLAGTYLQADETPVDVQTKDVAARIIKPICGSTARPEARWSSTSAWAADARVPSSFLNSSKAFCKPMATWSTIMSPEHAWCMLPVGRMQEEASSKRCN